MRIDYKGTTYTGPTRHLIIILRRDEGLSYANIGDLVGITRQAVHLTIRKHAPELLGRQTFPELKEADTYDKFSDEEIATNLGIKVSTVQKYRRLFGYKRQSINVHTRQLRFIREIFGASYKLGPLFHDNLATALTPYLTSLEIKRLVRFYIRGAKDDPSLRVHRAYIREKLIALTQDSDFMEIMQIAGVIANV